MRKAVRNSWSHTKPRGFLIIDIQTGELFRVQTFVLPTPACVKRVVPHPLSKYERDFLLAILTPLFL